jgi:hypothetical protein
MLGLCKQGEGGNLNIKTRRGDVVGIGKVKIPRTAEFDYEIPMLSFIVVKSEGQYVSSCLHLRHDGYGTSETNAIDDMIEMLRFFLGANFARLTVDNAWENIKDLFHIENDKDLIEDWNAYRDFQLFLAKKGISTDKVDILRKRIGQMERRIEQLEADNLELRKKFDDNLELIVEYTPLKEAA